MKLVVFGLIAPGWFWESRGIRFCDCVGRPTGHRTRAIGSARSVRFCKDIQPMRKSVRSAPAARTRALAATRGSITAARMSRAQPPDNFGAMTALLRTMTSSTSGSPRGMATSRAVVRGAMTCASATMASQRASTIRAHSVQSQWLEPGVAGRLGPGGQHRRYERSAQASRPSTSSQIGAPWRCSSAISRVPAGRSSASSGARSRTAPASRARAS
jgi:hypothetical protein